MSTLIATVSSTLGLSAERRAIRTFLKNVTPPVSTAVDRVEARAGFENWDVQVPYATAA